MKIGWSPKHVGDMLVLLETVSEPPGVYIGQNSSQKAASNI